jgi:hypothetical protein
VRGEVISYHELCRRERAPRLRRGMNFGLGGSYSVLLTTRRGLPTSYGDQFWPNNRRIVYRGHDALRRVEATSEPRFLDQPLATPTGRPTQNARFLEAAAAYRRGERPPERVRLYEKLEVNVWEDLGLFHLVDGWTEHDGRRTVVKLALDLVPGPDNGEPG